MQKNVKGIVSLVAALLAIVCIVIAFIPTAALRDTSVKFYGGTNVVFAAIAIPLGLIALIAGIMSLKQSDKKGPRKTGMILGILAILCAIFATAATSILSVVTNYANNPNDPAFSSMSQEQKDTIDKLIDQIVSKK